MEKFERFDSEQRRGPFAGSFMHSATVRLRGIGRSSCHRSFAATRRLAVLPIPERNDRARSLRRPFDFVIFYAGGAILDHPWAPAETSARRSKSALLRHVQASQTQEWGRGIVRESRWKQRKFSQRHPRARACRRDGRVCRPGARRPGRRRRQGRASRRRNDPRLRAVLPGCAAPQESLHFWHYNFGKRSIVARSRQARRAGDASCSSRQRRHRAGCASAELSCRRETSASNDCVAPIRD